MWIVVDKTNKVFLITTIAKPRRNEAKGIWETGINHTAILICFDAEKYPIKITWEDEPIEVSIMHHLSVSKLDELAEDSADDYVDYMCDKNKEFNVEDTYIAGFKDCYKRISL